MARTTEQLLEQAQRLLSPVFAGPLEPVLGAFCAALATAEDSVEGLHERATLEGATGQWLDLHGQGQGLTRRDGEGDDGYRMRQRRPDEQLTPSAILNGVNILLSPYTDTEAVLIEPWRDGPFMDHAYLDHTIVGTDLLSFVVATPRVGTPAGDVGAYMDHVFMDYTFLSADHDHPVYASIYELIQRARAAGVRGYLFIDDDEIYV